MNNARLLISRRGTYSTGNIMTEHSGITGIGTDIEEISRFAAMDRGSRLLKRVFTVRELEYCFSKRNAKQHLAVRFAGKEAVIKALSASGRKKPAYRDIEIINDDSGAPVVVLNREGFHDVSLMISLSHSRDMAVAFALVVSKS